MTCMQSGQICRWRDKYGREESKHIGTKECKMNKTGRFPKNVGWMKVDISEQNYIRAGQGTKTDYFSEKFQAAFDPPAPPPHFRKIMLQLFHNGYRAFTNWRHHIWLHMCK